MGDVLSDNVESTVESTEVEANEVPAQETDWKAEARKWEQRAKENRAKAKELEGKAAKYDEFEDAQKSEVEKLQARLEKAEREAAEYQTAALRNEVAAAKGVPANLLHGSSREELEAHADELISFRGEQKNAPSSPLLGKTNARPVDGTPADSFASFFNSHI